jgi:hypothetical protein
MRTLLTMLEGDIYLRDVITTRSPAKRNSLAKAFPRPRVLFYVHPKAMKSN